MLVDPLAAWPMDYDSLDEALRTIDTVGAAGEVLEDWYRRERERVASAYATHVDKMSRKDPRNPRTVTTLRWKDARASLLYHALGRLEAVAHQCWVITYQQAATSPPTGDTYRNDPRPVALVDDAGVILQVHPPVPAGDTDPHLPLRLATPAAVETGASVPADSLVVVPGLVTPSSGQHWYPSPPAQPVPDAARPVWDVLGFSADYSLLAATAEGFTMLAGLEQPARRKAPLLAQAGAYRATADTYWRAGGHAATSYLSPVAADQQLVAAMLSSTGDLMPVLAGSPAVDEAAARIAAALQAGGVARTGLAEGKESAFAWTPGVAPSIARFLTPAAAEGKSYDLAIFNQGVAVPGAVAEKAAKPLVGTVTERTVSLAKYAGIVSISQESAMYTANLATAIYQVVTSFCLKGFEAATVAELAAQASIDVAAATIAAGFFDAQSQIMAAGGQADLLVLSPANYAALMADTAAGGGYANFVDPSTGPTSTLFGAAIHVSSAVTAGKFYVLDRRSVLAIEHVASPIVIADPYSKVNTNEIQLAVELFAVPAVVNPGAVAEVTITP